MPRFLVIACLALSLSAFGASASEFSSLEERMSAAEFKAAGLDKLTSEELETLNRWLRGQRSLQPATAGAPAGYAPAPAIGGEDRRGLMESYGPGDEIHSRIVGEFRGWQGTKTVFHLENGMVWQSTDPGARLSVNLNNPSVTIAPGVMNAWFLQVEGYNAKVRVKRIK